MAFGYDAGMITKARTERSFTFAEGLLVELRDVRSGKARLRPLFFLAHSLGGIVVKKALIIASGRRTRYGDIFESTRHLMFFGTPHQGTTSTAGFLRRLGAALSADASVLRELELWSPQVLETNSAFLTEIAPMFTITTYWEREKISGVQVSEKRLQVLSPFPLTRYSTIGCRRRLRTSESNPRGCHWPRCRPSQHVQVH